MDDDRSCWTTAEVRGNTNKLQLENGDEVEIQKLYQWRLISLDEFIEVLNTNGIGLNPSISSLVKDRDFTRNANDFYGDHDWTVDKLSGYTYGTGTERYTYTWGDYTKGKTPLSNKSSNGGNCSIICSKVTWLLSASSKKMRSLGIRILLNCSCLLPMVRFSSSNPHQ